MIEFKCSHCGGKIEIEDVVVETDDTQIDYNKVRIFVTTQIKHTPWAMEPECAGIIQALVNEQTYALNKRVTYITSSSQDIHVL